MEDILGIFNELKDMYKRYMDSPFALNNDKLAKERNSLLQKEGIVYQYPYIEVLPPYMSSGKNVADFCEKNGFSKKFAEFCDKGLFKSNIKLHKHQYEAIRDVLINNKNIVVTSGTGSGKTETFLLPLIANILFEALKWPKSEKQQKLWDGEGSWVPSRVNEKRSAAIRGLILYPLNALVEDQLVRLRKALDSDCVRDWLNQNLKGNRIYFGRYTGKTPVPGENTSAKRNKLKQIIKNIETNQNNLRQRFMQMTSNLMVKPDFTSRQEIFVELQDELDFNILDLEELNPQQIHVIKEKLNEKLHEKLSYITQVDGAEMITRWDMQEFPPDILITNFSMLNIMLTRYIEQGIFDETRQWLSEDPSHIFHLVLDELHSYRGTAGTEVSYVLRTLLNRLGISPNSPQLRILATSASLDESGKGFLEDFFGIPIDSFRIIEGKRQQADIYPESNLFRVNCSSFKQFYEGLKKGNNINEEINLLCSSMGCVFDNQAPYESLHQLLSMSGAVNALTRICQRPMSLKDLSIRLFSSDPDLKTLGGFLSAIIKAKKNGEVLLPIRAHFFFRNFKGLWACSNPNCKMVEQDYLYADRPVGKLYSQPQVQCECGSRVLDFYYCQNCGDVFLGGYKTQSDSLNEEYILSADFPDLESLPDKLPLTKRYGEYSIYWPNMNIDPDAIKWKRSINTKISNKTSKTKNRELSFSWKKAHFNNQIGKILTDSHDSPTGYWFQIDGEKSESEKIPAFPIKCPNCADDWEGDRTEPLHSTKRTRSPIRGQRAGFDMITQVMLDTLMRQLSNKEKQKVVLFSDSRQDAAKLSIKIELNHYRHLLRHIIVQSIYQYQDNVNAFIRQVKGENLNKTEQKQAEDFFNNSYEKADLIEKYVRNIKLPQGKFEEAKKLYEEANSPPKLGNLWDDSEQRILSLGINPGGPYNSVHFYKDGIQKYKWTNLYNWTDLRHPLPLNSLNHEQRTLREAILKSMKDEIISNVLFSQRKRDLESLVLAYISTDIDKIFDNNFEKGAEFWRELVNSSIRILGGMRRYEGNRQPIDYPPSRLKQYWKCVAKNNKLNSEELISKATEIFEKLQGVKSYLLIPNEICLIRYKDYSETIYRCEKCNRVHLHPSCETCTDCHNRVVTAKYEDLDVSDFYRYLALDPKSFRRFHSEEMTGQTDSETALIRQQLFQGIYDNKDIPLVEEIDLLSVTTTMEAGVDIGSLRVVGMSNMPPQRFNYQQRIGRCGRRGSALSIGLTLCRGRSHDDWYFDNLDRMTGDPPPQPYIDLKSKKIFRRVFVKECLFNAYNATGLSLELAGQPDSVHGEFGSVSDWSNYKKIIQGYFSSKSGEIKILEILNSLSIRTNITKSVLTEMFEYIKYGSLVEDITIIAEDPKYSSSYLSENLASAGLLPMFGFPTRLRLLHHKKRSSFDNSRALESGVISRDLDLAISEFAPSSEVVKDKIKHRAVGIAHYWVRGNKLVTEENPFGKFITISLCTNCHLLYDKPQLQPAQCPSCGAVKDIDDSYRSIRLCEPQGFRSEWIDRDYKEEFEWFTRSSVPRLAQEGSKYQIETVYNLEYWSQDGNVYSINDNSGKLFNFVKAKNPYEGWIEENCIELDKFNPLVSDQVESTALASIKNTEILLISPHNVPTGITYNTSNLGTRAGLISFGFLFRRLASSILDVDADELQVGVRPVILDINDKNVVGQIFIADRLINGAGYAKYLGQEKILKTIIEDLTTHLNYVPKLRNHNCDSSCYECLRTYSNMSYHGLLDWRLGLDVAQMLKSENFTPSIDEKWKNVVRNALKILANNYGGKEIWLAGVPGIKFLDDKLVLLFGHPFWTKKEDYFNESFSDATVEAEGEFNGMGTTLHYDIFDLIRRPVWVMQNVIERINQ